MEKRIIFSIIGVVIGLICFVFAFFIYDATKIIGYPLGTCVVDGIYGTNPSIEDKLDCIIFNSERQREEIGMIATFAFIIIGVLVVVKNVKDIVIGHNDKNKCKRLIAGKYIS